MLFNSYLFVLLFLPITLLGYYGLNKFKKYKSAKFFLILMSLWFYGFNNYYYLIIIIGSILFNFTFCKFMYNTANKNKLKVLLVLGILFNIGILAYYKYYDFFIENLNTALKTDFNFINVMLPLGISFFTFQQLSFVIDSYKKQVPKYNILDYSLFVTFFPQLVAGPIVLHSEIIPQFENVKNKCFNSENFYKGLYAFSMGLAKKVLLADTLSLVVNYGFSSISQLGTINALIVMISYTLQIAFDFSGYSDMAIGIGRMFNIDIPLNFDTPYKSLSVTEFWRRWHITLSRFFKSYVYIPLGGNRKGAIRTYINMFIVFLVSGLWHGANWTFVLWGVLHGLAITFEKTFDKLIKKMNPIICWICTFCFINLTWILFRAESINKAMALYKQIISFRFTNILETIIDSITIPEMDFLLEWFGHSLPSSFEYIYISLFYIASIFASIQFANIKVRLNKLEPTMLSTVTIVTLLTWCIVSFSGVTEFIYFNF